MIRLVREYGGSIAIMVSLVTYHITHHRAALTCLILATVISLIDLALTMAQHWRAPSGVEEAAGEASTAKPALAGLPPLLRNRALWFGWLMLAAAGLAAAFAVYVASPFAVVAIVLVVLGGWDFYVQLRPVKAGNTPP